MYSLFWRIFVSFWLVLLVAEYAAVTLTASLSESSWHPALELGNKKFLDNAKAGARVLSQGGVGAYRMWRLRDADFDNTEELFVLDSSGTDIDGQVLPADISSFAADPLVRVTLSDHAHPIETLITHEVTAPDGQFYVLVATFKPPPVFSYTLSWQRIVVGVVISGIVCFLLARYISAPIVRLRQTTHALADGKLDARAPRPLRDRKDEFGVLAADFDYMAERLNTMIGTQKQLLRDVSHELRSPLARIQVALELARKQVDGKATRELDRIQRESDRLNTLIDELLKLVRMTAADSEGERSEFDLCDLLKGIVEDAVYENSQGEPGIVRLEHCDDARISGFESLLYSAIENIVRNACYYAPDQAKVVVRCIAEVGTAIVTVEDNGPGIPDSMLARVFDPFVRVSSAREKETGGYGIGLAIAKRAIALHGGTISARNNADRPGLTMTIELPLVAQERRVQAV